jgi:hypothetical protein
MACESGNFTIADSRSQSRLRPIEWIGPLILVKLNPIGERRGKPRQHLTIGEGGDVSIGDLHAQVV